MIRILFVSATNPTSVKHNLYPPLWPAFLAAYAVDRLGPQSLEFRYVSQRLENELVLFKPHVVGISSVTENFHRAVDIASMAKSHNIPVIIGGMHITSLPGCLSDGMTVGCIGEGEQTFVELMQLFLDKGALSTKGLESIDGIKVLTIYGPCFFVK